MSIGFFYKPVFESGIPILSGERVFTRFLALPILVLLIGSIIQYQAILENNLGKPIHLFYFWLINLIVANDLTQHASLWSLDKIIELFPAEIPLTGYSIQNHVDPVYIAMIWIGILLSVISFFTLIFIVKKSQTKPLKLIKKPGI